MRAWDREFPEYAHLMINVNLSARQCMEPNLVRDVSRILTETGLEAPEPTVPNTFRDVDSMISRPSDGGDRR
jgi:EAL domain-containing protein (putative c-di-GMP-specific phosphodiesterase class I)